MAGLEHTPIRKTWLCGVCEEAWPCEPAKKMLLATLSPTQLAIKGWGDLEAAAKDIPDMPVREAFTRFVSWTWPENAAVLRPMPE